MRTELLVVAATALALPCMVAEATTYRVEQFVGSTSVRVDTPNSGASFTIPLYSTSVNRIVVTAASDVDIGALSFSGTAPSGTIDFLLGVSESQSDCSQAVTGSAGRDWAGVNVDAAGSPKIAIYGRIGRHLTGSVGKRDHRVEAIYRLEVAGTVDHEGGYAGQVAANYGAGAVEPFTVVCGSISANSAVVLFNGKLSKVRTTSGDLGGEVRAVAGNIGDVVVDSGNLTARVLAVAGSINSIDVSGNITSAHWDAANDDPNSGLQNAMNLFPIRAKDGLFSTVANAISADFTVSGSSLPDTGEGDGIVHLFKTRTGDFSGRLMFGAIQPFSNPLQECGILIAGDLNSGVSTEYATIRAFCRPVASTTLIRIGGNLGPYGSITFDEGAGLNTQVIVNGSAGTGSSAGAWSGNVNTYPYDTASTPCHAGAPTITLSPSSSGSYQAPYYPQVSSGLGGGAVGLVPYHLHAEDCAPEHADDWGSDTPPSSPLLNSLFSQGTQSVRLRFYGPVYTNAAGGLGGEGVTLWYWITRSLQWQDVTDAATVTLPRSAGAAWSRDITLTGNGAHLPPGFYAVVARTDLADSLRLICNGTTGATPPSPGANMGGLVQYNFRLWADCDNDGVIDTGGLGARTFCHGDGCAADVDDGSGLGIPDGGVDINDMLFYLSIYEASAPGADVDDGSGTGTLDDGVDINDLLFFLDRYEGGC